MLRTLAIVLLLANLLLAAALAGLFDRLAAPAASGREPERLARQHQPERLQVLPPAAASAALRAAAASAQASAAAAGSLLCLEAGPFSDADAELARRTLHDAGVPEAAVAVHKTEDPGAFMVYMGRYGDREMLQKKLGELTRLKVQHGAVADLPELQPGIDLGRHDNRAAADAALAQLATRGVRTARVVTLRQAQNQTLLRAPAADGALRARLAGLQMPSGPGFLPCSAEAAAAPASAAPGAASAASAAAGGASAAVSGAGVGTGSAPGAGTKASAPAAPAAQAASAAPVVRPTRPAASAPAAAASPAAPRPTAPAAPAAPASRPAASAARAAADAASG